MMARAAWTSRRSDPSTQLLLLFSGAVRRPTPYKYGQCCALLSLDLRISLLHSGGCTPPPRRATAITSRTCAAAAAAACAAALDICTAPDVACVTRPTPHSLRISTTNSMLAARPPTAAGSSSSRTSARRAVPAAALPRLRQRLSVACAAAPDRLAKDRLSKGTGLLEWTSRLVPQGALVTGARWLLALARDTQLSKHPQQHAHQHWQLLFLMPHRPAVPPPPPACRAVFPLAPGAKTGWRLAWETMVKELAPQDRSGAYARPAYAFDGQLGSPQFPVRPYARLLFGGRLLCWPTLQGPAVCMTA